MAKAVKSGATLRRNMTLNGGTRATDSRGYLGGSKDLTRYENSGTERASMKGERTFPVSELREARCSQNFAGKYA